MTVQHIDPPTANAETHLYSRFWHMNDFAARLTSLADLGIDGGKKQS